MSSGGNCDRSGDGAPEEMVRTLKSIVSGASEAEIYEALLECKMDRNDAALRLLSLGKENHVKSPKGVCEQISDQELQAFDDRVSHLTLETIKLGDALNPRIGEASGCFSAGCLGSRDERETGSFYGARTETRDAGGYYSPRTGLISQSAFEATYVHGSFCPFLAPVTDRVLGDQPCSPLSVVPITVGFLESDVESHHHSPSEILQVARSGVVSPPTRSPGVPFQQRPRNQGCLYDRSYAGGGLHQSLIDMDQFQSDASLSRLLMMTNGSVFRTSTSTPDIYGGFQRNLGITPAPIQVARSGVVSPSARSHRVPFLQRPRNQGCLYDQSYAGGGLHRSLIDMDQFQSGASSSRIPVITNANVFQTYTSTIDIYGCFQRSLCTTPAPIQDDSLIWSYDAGSRAMLPVPSQNQQHPGYWQNERVQQRPSAPGYPDYYGSQTCIGQSSQQRHTDPPGYAGFYQPWAEIWISQGHQQQPRFGQPWQQQHAAPPSHHSFSQPRPMSPRGYQQLGVQSGVRKGGEKRNIPLWRSLISTGTLFSNPSHVFEPELGPRAAELDVRAVTNAYARGYDVSQTHLVFRLRGGASNHVRKRGHKWRIGFVKPAQRFQPGVFRFGRSVCFRRVYDVEPKKKLGQLSIDVNDAIEDEEVTGVEFHEEMTGVEFHEEVTVAEFQTEALPKCLVAPPKKSSSDAQLIYQLAFYWNPNGGWCFIIHGLWPGYLWTKANGRKKLETIKCPEGFGRDYTPIEEPLASELEAIWPAGKKKRSWKHEWNTHAVVLDWDCEGYFGQVATLAKEFLPKINDGIQELFGMTEINNDRIVEALEAKLKARPYINTVAKGRKFGLKDVQLAYDPATRKLIDNPILCHDKDGKYGGGKCDLSVSTK